MELGPSISGLGKACCGCGACEAICPKGAIRLIESSFGFRYASVSDAACIDCGACENVCPAINVSVRDGLVESWWAKALAPDLLERSSSGGVFGLLSRKAISMGGAVYGAAFDDDCKTVSHRRITSMGSLDSVMRSKYLQSVVSPEVFEGVRNDLRNGQFVLFAGTACQIAGLKSYLGRRSSDENLLCVDVICHGVPSPRLWSKWVEHGERRAGLSLQFVNFRSKTTGWLSYSVLYEYGTERGKAAAHASSVFYDDWYMKAFLANASLRESCFCCPAKRSCGSDITLGDYWGFQDKHPDVNYESGISAVMANTEKGLKAFEAIADECEYGVTAYENILAGNPSLEKSATPFADRERFMGAIESDMDISYMMRKWSFTETRGQRTVRKLKHFIKTKLLDPNQG